MSAINYFDILMPNLLQCNSNGSSLIGSMPIQLLNLPKNIATLSIPNLPTLVNTVGTNNVKITYFATAVGNISSCSQCNLLCQGNWSGSNSDPTSPEIGVTTIASASSNIVTLSGNEVQLNTSAPNIVIKSIQTSSKGGGNWSGVNVSLRVHVEVNLSNYCTTMGKNYITGDICYNYMSGYLPSLTSQSPYKISEATSNYLTNYCARQFPNGTLDLFNPNSNIDPKDYNICACNMGPQTYNEFKTSLTGEYPSLSIGTINPNCLFTPCLQSDFKPDQCPVPQCFNAVVMSGNDISGSVDINQSANCTSLGISSDGTDNGSSDGSSDGTDTTTNNFISKYKIPIIILLIFILVIIIILILFFIFKKKQNVTEDIE